MAADEITGREFGALEAHVSQLEKKVESLEEKVDQLLSLANKGKGAWWAALTAASAFGAIATFVTSHFWPR